MNRESGLRSNPVFSAAGSLWALLLGVAFLMLGNGLQGTLLSLRAATESFGSTVTGFVMTGYFIGFLLGSMFALKTIRRVGHLRVFAATTSLASLSILVQSLFVDPLVWGLMRVVTGYCLASAYIVTESWLNDRVTNQHRGGLLAVYMVISYIGMSGGQLLLLTGSPSDHDLFIICSALITFAAVPILLSISPQPIPENVEGLAISELYKVSPLGFIGSFGSGLLQGAIFSMGAVYTYNVGLTNFETSLFMFSLIVGAALLQWPIGKLSDRIDRRKVIAGLALFGSIVPIISGTAFSLGPSMVIVSAALIGLGPLLLYSLFIAYTNDYLRPEQFVAAGSGLILVFGSGAVLGPPITGMVMDIFGSQAFLWFLAAGHLLIFAFCVYRMTQRESIPVEEQTIYAGATVRTASLAPAVADWVQAQSEDDAEDAGSEDNRVEKEAAQS
ncbi:MAG: MFS transporter [Hyphomicrobiales bacterium]|nr:MFS transporter [Hyphomicrobiales bacterium]